jgi:hypothetical protein
VKILITAASSAAAHQLKNKLNTGNIILGDHHELPGLMIRMGSMIKLPNPASPAYAHEMLTLCLDRDITVVYALNIDELLLLNEARQLFKEYNIDILGD